MKILIIDNNIDPKCWGASDICKLARLAQGATICVRRAPQNDLPKDPSVFDRIIVSGSKTSPLEDAPWINNLLEFIQSAIRVQKPFFGVCYGHQILARALGNKESVRISKTPEFGWSKIQITEPSLLFYGMPSSFYSFSSHFDEVAQLPKGMKRLAYSEACEIQACQLEGLPIFGIQFHPEKTLVEAKRSLKIHKKDRNHSSLLHADRSEELFDPKVGEILFKNFLELKKL